MRNTPSVSAAGGITIQLNGTAFTLNSVGSIFGNFPSSSYMMDLTVTGATLGTSGNIYTDTATTSYFQFSAEL